MKRQLSIFIALAICAAFVGCTPSADTAATTSGTSETTTTGGATLEAEKPAGETPKTEEAPKTEETPVAETEKPAEAASDAVSKGVPTPLPADTKWVSVAGRAPKDGEEVAVFDTAQGEIVLMFFPDTAPNHVKQYKNHIKTGAFNGTYFHRVIPGFMIQGGDPNTKNSDKGDDGQGGTGQMIAGEFNNIDHVKGIWSTARTNDPASAQSQFFIMADAYPSLNGQYTAFGKVVSGQDAVDKIVALPRDQGDNPNDSKAATIKSAKLVKWPYKGGK